ncbi:MAG: TIGR03000 domain-containing protein [Planctomycetaceae bacterium]|nr:TIGR03000 domain-containing protein [Planctomycetaceae bacterium]
MKPAESASVQTSGKAQIVLHVPADADVYLVGQKMTTAGELRTFNSPVLEAGKTFGYPIRVELQHEGKTFKAEGKQLVRSGDHVEIKVAFDKELGMLSMVQVEGQASVLELVQLAPASDLVAQN